VADDTAELGAGARVRLRQAAMPVLNLSLAQRYNSIRVQQVLRVLSRLFKDQGAVIERLFERKLADGWITGVGVRSEIEFPYEDDARAWWQGLVDRLHRELPHQKLLAKPLDEERFSFTTMQLLAISGRINSAYAGQ